MDGFEDYLETVVVTTNSPGQPEVSRDPESGFIKMFFAGHYRLMTDQVAQELIISLHAILPPT